MHGAWQLAHRHIRHSLEGGYYQGWDLHPAQLPVRYATCYAFFLEGLASAGERLNNFIEKAAQATLVGDVFDDAATGQGLLNYFLRALNCGAIDLDDVRTDGAHAERSRAALVRQDLGGAPGAPDAGPLAAAFARRRDSFQLFLGQCLGATPIIGQDHADFDRGPIRGLLRDRPGQPTLEMDLEQAV